MAATAPAGLGFTTQVTPGLIDLHTRQFGGAVLQRIASWVDFARRQKGSRRVAGPPDLTGAELDALQSVNAFFNRITFRPDAEHWGSEDYWATPAEMTSSNAGDCEDYSIAKYFLLKELGVPVERLRITYVKAVRINQAHMVLAYYASPGAVPLILDNLEQEVRPATERTDLVPVYSFNDDDIVIVRDARKSNPLQIRAWRQLLAKLEAEAQL
jgi:predicted transglutaminase-like cysteine proteinase